MDKIINSNLIGSFVNITLPGWDGKGEQCPIHYVDIGEGSPLLLLHSPGQSLYTFRDMIPQLSKSFRVIAPDLPGFGFSGRPISCNYSMEEMGEAILLFMEAIGLKKTYVLAASLSCGYLLCAMEKAPASFGKTTLLCPGEVSDTMPSFIRLMAAPLIGPFVRELYTKGSVHRHLKTAYYDTTVCNKEVLKEYFKTLDSYASRQSFMYTLRNYDMDSVVEGVKGLAHSFFIMWGQKDSWQPPEQGDLWKRRLPGAYFYALSNGGHFFWEEKPKETADAIERFIRF